MDKAQFLQTLRARYARWDALLADVNETNAHRPVAAGTWSIKDTVAHVTWYEREMVNLVQQRVLAGSALWELKQDERNAAIYRQDRDRSLADVLQEARAVHQQLVEALEALPEEHYGNPHRFQHMPSDWVPWEVLEGNTYEHYQDHLAEVRAALDASEEA